jgi:Mlc titration factor MtfA (ptsG expression regulator)
MGWLAERRRKRLRAAAFPDHWHDILDRNVAAYRLQSAAERQRSRELVSVFLAEKQLEGCGGLDMTDEIRVTIAGSAAQLALVRGDALFDNVASIVVYPSAVVSRRPDVAVYTSPTPIAEGIAIDGEAHPHGAVVLAWDAVLAGALDPGDGRNVVIHEFAHKIDFLDGAANGTPPLPDRRARAAWRDAFQPAYEAHRWRAAAGIPSLIRDYATTNPAEYFACACEVFFEQPEALRAELPAVYAQLAAFFTGEL